MIRVLESNSFSSIEDVMLLVFNNEYAGLNTYGKELFDKDYPDWNNKENIRKYFYDCFDIDDEMKSYFRLADKGNPHYQLQYLYTLSDMPSYEKSIIRYLINALGQRLTDGM